MPIMTEEEHHAIVERLAQIKVERDAAKAVMSPNRVRLVEDLDREETELLKKLAEHDPD